MRRRAISAVVDGKPYQEIVRSRLGVFDLAIEVIVACERIGVIELELGFKTRAASVGFTQRVVREPRLRVLVQRFSIRMSWSRVEVVVTFLDVFTVVAFGAGESVKSLLQDGVAGIPKRE